MAKNSTQFFPANYGTVPVTFATSDGTTAKDIVAAGANDSIIRSLVIVSNDTAIQTITLTITNGSGVTFILGVFVVAPGSGTDGNTAAVDALSASWLPLANGKRYLPLQTGWKIQGKMAAAVTGGDAVSILPIAENY